MGTFKLSVFGAIRKIPEYALFTRGLRNLIWAENQKSNFTYTFHTHLQASEVHVLITE